MTPFVIKNALAQLRVTIEQGNHLERAVELELQAFRKQDEETPLHAKE